MMRYLIGRHQSSSPLLAKLGSAMPYRKAVALLRQLLPLTQGEVSYGNVRRRTLAVGGELERRATDRAEYDEYGPGRKGVASARQITVALDGTWIRADGSARGRQLHVIAGRIDRDGHLGGRFAWVPEAARGCSPNMTTSALVDEGFADGTKLSVLADGADGLTGLVHDGSNRRPTAQLDWFHVSMRQRHIEQMTPDRRSYRGSGDTMLGTEAREEVALAGLARACDGGSTVADSTQSGGEDCYEVLRSRDA
jgi:hypothetical protein